jgi:hypothetical protein
MVLDIHIVHVSIDNPHHAKRMQTTISSLSTKDHMQALFTRSPKGGSANTKVVREILAGRRGRDSGEVESAR